VGISYTFLYLSNNIRQSQQKDMNNDMKSLNERIEDYKAQIAKEEEKLLEAEEGKKEKLLEEVKERENIITAKEERIEELRESIRNHAESQKEKKDMYDKARADDAKLREEIIGCDSAIQNLTHAAQGELNKYGRSLPNLLRQIEGEAWRGRKPIGPIGNYVKLKDPQWKSVLQTQLGRLMTAFVVENSADRNQLIGMLKQSNK
jgi:structural maintenance of chromosomes protein 6